MSTQSSRSRLTALGCAVLTGSLWLPAVASAQSADRLSPILNAGRAAAARQANTMKERAAAQAAPTPPTSSTDLRSKSFFKSRAGVATLLIFGGGVAYALYSSSNDRIRSEGR